MFYTNFNNIVKQAFLHLPVYTNTFVMHVCACISISDRQYNILKMYAK